MKDPNEPRLWVVGVGTALVVAAIGFFFAALAVR